MSQSDAGEAEILGGDWPEPIQKALASGRASRAYIAFSIRCTGDDDWGPRERAGLRSAVANRQWPQARLCSAGLAESPACQLCEKANLLRHIGVAPPRSLSECCGFNMPSTSYVPTAPPIATAVMTTADNVLIGTLIHRVWDCTTTL